MQHTKAWFLNIYFLRQNDRVNLRMSEFSYGECIVTE